MNVSSALRFPTLLFSSVFLLSACGGSDKGPETFVVSASASTGGSISPSSVQVEKGKTASLSVSVTEGYLIRSVAGCGGSLSGNAFQTGPITANCTVTAAFDLKTYDVNVNDVIGGQLTPNKRVVEHGKTTSFTVVSQPGYGLVSVSGCGGTLNADVYTTGAVTQACEITPVFAELKGLSVQRFGSGRIVDTAANFSCDASVCEQDFFVGTSLKLAATADANWQLSHWHGCDTVNQGVCEVTLSETVEVFPVFERIADPVLKNNVVVLDAAFMQGIQQVYDESIILKANANLAGLEVGKVIVSQEGEGFARVITNVVLLSGSGTILQTRTASLEEVIETGTIVFNKEFTAQDVVGAVGVADQLKVAGIEFRAASVPAASNSKLTYDVNYKIDDGLVISGQVELSYTADFAFDFTLTGINEVRIIHDVKANPVLALTVSKEIFGIEREINLPPIQFMPFMVGPVVFTPRLEPRLELKADASAKVVFNAGIEVNGRYGAHFKRNEGWRAIRSVETKPNVNIGEASLTANALASVNQNVAMLLYGVAGPGLEVSPYAELEATFDPVGICGDWQTYLGLKSSATFQGRVLGWSLGKVDLTLFDFKRPVAGNVFVKACNGDPELTLAKPGLPEATSRFTNGFVLKWDYPADVQQHVKHFELWRDGKKNTEIYNNRFVDMGLKPDTTYCYKVIAVGKSGVRSDESAERCVSTLPLLDEEPPTIPLDVKATPLSSSSIELSWSAAMDDVSEVSYLIMYDGVVINGTDELSLVMLRLKANTEYCFTVAAVDAAGNASQSSALACATTKEATAYRARAKCMGASTYVMDTRLDLDVEYSDTVSVAGNATDYNGTPMSYVITALYDSSSMDLTGRIDWAFQGSSNTRLDEFVVNLQQDDTGDVTMNQVKVTGCTAQIRFTRDLVEPSGGEMQPIDESIIKENISSFSRFH